jgi:hypothetical protein
MKTIRDGGPVHPVRLPFPGAKHANDEPVPTELHPGMTLRDYFAAKAMPLAIQALDNPDNDPADQRLQWNTDEDGPSSDQVLAAKYAYGMADAMLAARES